MSVKLRHNISSWDSLKLNYWGLPKCGNTSIKYALAKASELKLQKVDDTCVWVHKENLTKYITPQQAIQNGFKNFTVVRDPIERFISMYKDIHRREQLGRKIGKNKSINTFLKYLEKTPDEKRDVHFRSQCYFLVHNEKVIPDILTYDEIEAMLNVKLEKLNTIKSEVKMTDEQKNKVHELFIDDYKKLGFKYE